MVRAGRLVVPALVLGLLGYEAWALLNHERDDTISEIMWTRSRRPVVPFALGVLMGHFFWQREP
jgi:hypothetical protein